MRTWRTAMQQALYGTDGFYVRERPAAHFRTSVTTSPLFAEAVRALAERVDAALGRPDPFDLVDLGAGGGELLAALGDVPARWRLRAVDVHPGAARTVPRTTGLLLANEWLDVVPLDVLEGDRLVLVSPTGEEGLGPVADPEALAWRDRWWPDGVRVEVGLPRDRAWAWAVGRLDRGLAVAIDYGHEVATRRPTLTGYRAGQQVPPVPDGTCDLTAHVALDSCAAATGATLVSQRAALHALGVHGRLPVPLTAAGLARANAGAVLTDPAGLGGFGWLVQHVDCPTVLEPPGR